jgi:hypothetical protein
VTRFRVYEIEHQGDVDASVEDLKRAGCTGVRILATDFEAECMVVECTLPAGLNSHAELAGRLKFACVWGGG